MYKAAQYSLTLYHREKSDKVSFDIVTFILRVLTAQTGLHGPEAMTSFAWSLYSHLLPVGSVDPFNLGSGLPHPA